LNFEQTTTVFIIYYLLFSAVCYTTTVRTLFGYLHYPPPSDGTPRTCSARFESTQIESTSSKASTTMQDMNFAIEVSPETALQKLQHVLGHQDNLNRPLTLLEKLNVQMDARAKHIALNHLHYRTQQISEQHAGYGKIFIDGTLITGHIQKTLNHHILHKQMIEFLANKWSIDEEILTTQVDWYAFGKARKEVSFPIQRFMSKWISGDTANFGERI